MSYLNGAFGASAGGKHVVEKNHLLGRDACREFAVEELRLSSLFVALDEDLAWK